MSKITASFFFCVLLFLLQGCTATMEGLQRDFQSLSVPRTGSGVSPQQGVEPQQSKQYESPDPVTEALEMDEVQRFISSGKPGSRKTVRVLGTQVTIFLREDSYLSQEHGKREVCRKARITIGKEAYDTTFLLNPRKKAWVEKGVWVQ